MANDRRAEADAIKAEIGALYWPFGLLLYPLLAVFTVGLGLWFVWALQERRIGTRTAPAVIRPLASVLLSFVPLAYWFIAASYGRNLFYISRPEQAFVRRGEWEGSSGR